MDLRISTQGQSLASILRILFSALQAENKKIQREVERHNCNLQISQAATLDISIEAQRAIHDAEGRTKNAGVYDAKSFSL